MKKYKLIKFSASWCKPCEAFTPVVLQATESRTELEVLSVDVDEEHSTAEEYGIMSIPAILLLNEEGSEIARCVGAMSLDNFNSWLDKNVG